MALYRGTYKLAHMSQVLGRDEKAAEISRHFGGEAMGYMLTDEQHAERERGSHRGLPYRFLVYSPQSCALSWTAFYTREDLAAFVAAYGCTLDREPSPGERFTIKFPADASAFLPLVSDDRVTFSQLGIRNMGFLEVDAASVDAARLAARAWLDAAGEPMSCLTPAEPVSIGPNVYRIKVS